MNKRTIIIWTIITSLLSLIFILASYYGYIRYLQIRIKPSSDYAEKYKYLPRASKNRTIISFYTPEKNLDKIKPMINSILDQTVRVDQILLPCSYSIPEYLKTVVSPCPVMKNYGKGTAFVPVLLKEKNADTAIIVLKDGIVYGKDYIETLVTRSEQDFNTVITDQKQDGVLIRPECYDNCNALMSNSGQNLDEKWLVDNAKNVAVIEYDENIRY